MVAARSRRRGATSKALGAVKYDISRRVPTWFSPSRELAGSLTKKSHAAPLTGASARAGSAVALARANCPELARPRLVERSVLMKRAPVNAASAQGSPLIAPISAARTAGVWRAAAASVPLGRMECRRALASATPEATSKGRIAQEQCQRRGTPSGASWTPMRR